MKSLKEVQEDVGYNPRAACPEVKERWAAYKGGAVQFFDTAVQAKRFSPLIEEIDANAAKKKFRADQAALREKAAKEFNRLLRAEFANYSDEEYALAYAYVAESANEPDDFEEALTSAFDFAKAFAASRG